MSISLCSEKKGQVLKHNLPSRVQWGWVRAQLAAPSGPGPETLLTVSAEGAGHPTQLALRLLRPCGGGRGTGPADDIPGRWYCQEVAEAGKVLLPPQGLGPASRGHSEGSGGQQDTTSHMSPGPPEHPLVGGWMNWSTLEGRLVLTLTSLSTWRSLLQWPCLNVPTNYHSLTVASLGEKPIANSWTGLVAW